MQHWLPAVRDEQLSNFIVKWSERRIGLYYEKPKTKKSSASQNWPNPFLFTFSSATLSFGIQSFHCDQPSPVFVSVSTKTPCATQYGDNALLNAFSSSLRISFLLSPRDLPSSVLGFLLCLSVLNIYIYILTSPNLEMKGTTYFLLDSAVIVSFGILNHSPNIVFSCSVKIFSLSIKFISYLFGELCGRFFRFLVYVAVWCNVISFGSQSVLLYSLV